METSGSGGLEPAAPAPWREVFVGARGRLTAGLLVLEAVAAMEALVVATILPAVRRDLGDVQLYGWAFSAYSLAAFGTISVAGRAVDRYGPRRPLGFMLALYGLGLMMAALAPSMVFLVLGRFVQGLGAGGLYSVSLGAIATTYPDRLRPRVMALLASMWIIPGLLGPPLGAFLASTVGWRWAFLAPLPALAAACILVFPALGNTPAKPSQDVTSIAVRWPIQLMVGVAMVLGSLTDPSLWSIPLIAVGLVVAIPALLKIVPSGTLRAKPGLPAAAAAAFMLSATFLAADGFVPLMLTGLRGLSVGEAGLVITLVTFSWSGGSWWQSRRATTWTPARLVTIGGVLLAIGLIGVMSGLIPAVPVVTVYVGWLIAGAGMGISFPTIPFAVMREADEGKESSELSSTLLMDLLGVGIGAGLGGACIAVTQAAGLDLRTGLIGAFTIALIASGLLIAIAQRLPTGPGEGAAPQ
jgi:MFS family permease